MIRTRQALIPTQATHDVHKPRHSSAPRSGPPHRLPGAAFDQMVRRKFRELLLEQR